jgi:signal transduction histidine kinase/DNA-binding response OmpR family regulator
MMDEKVNILVVDDLPEKLLVYESILEELGQNVVTASSGAEALKKVLQQRFAVILLDVNMPGMDGFETAALIRNRKRSAHTPIIFITAFVDELRAVEGYAAGAVDYILAPVVPDVLRAKVRVFVDLFRMHEHVQRQAVESVALAEERAKRAAAEEASRCSAFLAQASTILANTMDFEATLGGLARVVVPFLADLSIASVLQEGRPVRLEWAWADPSGLTVQPPSLPALHPAPWLAAAMDRALESGRAEVVPSLDPASAATASPPGAAASNVPAFDIASAAVLPLNARGKTLGALVLGRGPSGQRYSTSDMVLAEDLAARAAIALDNALLLRNIQEADRRKDEFLAMLAHELRNPLAPICNAVQIMGLIGFAEPELQSARDVIDRQLRHLTRLVDDLLDVSRITSGKIRLVLEPLDVGNIVAAAVEASRPLIVSRRQELNVVLPPQPLQVRADQARLAQILSNLLNNAAKYTGEGGRIWLDAQREGDEAVFRVRDTGAGIPPEILPRIFDLFTQAEQSLDRSQGGLGIGLTLVRRLVEMHHGTVQAFSEGPEMGSEFVVRLPALAEQPARAVSSNGAEIPEVNGVARRVLVVDDNPDTAASLAMIIRLDGHEVRTAHSGEAALQEFSDFQPQVVFLDIGLPNMDGYELARRLRAQSQGKPILMAAITGYGNEEDRFRSQQSGLDFHLVKPVRLDALRRLLANSRALPMSATPF